jgi:hypothetical protein
MYTPVDGQAVTAVLESIYSAKSLHAGIHRVAPGPRLLLPAVLYPRPVLQRRLGPPHNPGPELLHETLVGSSGNPSPDGDVSVRDRPL